MVILFVVLSIFSIILIFLLELANIEELVLGALFGAFISIVITIFIEYTNFKSEQSRYRDEYFWEQINPYRDLLDELFLYARDVYYLEYLFDGISKDEGDWRMYESFYLTKQLILDMKIQPYIEMILRIGNRNLNGIGNISYALSRIERKNFFGGESKYYKKAYKIYQIIENINWSLDDAYKDLVYIQNISNNIEKRCSQIIVCRRLSDQLCNNYDRGITDLTHEEVESSFSGSEYNDLVAKKDLDLAIYDYAKNIK